MKTSTTPETPTEPKPRKGGSQIGGRLWKTCLGLLVAGAGWIFVLYLWGSYQRAKVMDDWVEVPASIVSSEIDDSALTQRGTPKYRLDVRYDYVFEGKDYRGNRVTRLPVESGHLGKVQKKQEDFRTGQVVSAFVNPQEPSTAVLKRDTKAPLYSIWFPFLFVFGGLGISITAWIRR
ncbi:MAG: DUF3592 domain-containing protein [Verrucomicrobiota bacterium]